MPSKRLEKMLEKINKGFKDPVAAPLSQGIRSEVKTVIPTGVEAVDKYVLGKGGLPCGRLVELFADEGAGKTSFALSCIAGAQRIGAVTFLAETECALEPDRPATFGVDWDELIKLEPGHWGEVMEQTEACLLAMPKGVPGLFVLDSVAATPSADEVGGLVVEKEKVANRARAVADFMRRLGPLAVEKQVCFLFVNQIRQNIGVLFGPDTTTPGGRAMKFHSSVRLCIYPGKAEKGVGGEHIGKVMTIQAVKNKLVSPWRKTKMKLMFETGFDSDWSTLYHAKEMKLVKPRSRNVEEARTLLEEARWSSSAAKGTGEKDEEADS